MLSALHTDHTSWLGFINVGGTLDLDGMLFVNRCSWAHCVDAVARLLDRRLLLDADEIDALDGRRSPDGVIVGVPERNGRRTSRAV